MIPIRELIRPSADETAIRRMWHGIEDRLEPRRRRPVAVLAAFAVAAAVAIVVALAMPHAPARARSLTLADGRPVPRTLTTDTRFSDGSTIAIGGARLEVLENGARQVSVLLHEGRARFSVQPGGPRRWIVEGGLARLEVIGTVFAVSRTSRTLTVTVERGTVLVRGGDVPDGVRRLEAGDELVVETPEVAVIPAPPPPAPLPPPPAPPPSRPARRAAAPAPAADPPAPRAIEQLLADADDLRRAGRLDEAVRVLGGVADTPGDPLAGIAWFTRAKVLLELGRTDHAAVDFERALASGLPPVLEERARARLAELRP